MNAFNHMVSFLDTLPKQQISKQEYEIFCKEYIFDQLKGKRFGRAFCERFNVNDTVVKCLFDEDIAREMITENYIQ
jgi:hypothetical protein